MSPFQFLRNRFATFAVLVCIVTVFLLCVTFGNRKASFLEDEGVVDSSTVNILPEESFVSNDLYIEIEGRNEKGENKFFYTLDGSVPTIESERYTEPIKIAASEELQVVVIRVCELVNNKISEPTTRTFFVGKNIDERFSTKVVSIVTDEDGLYGYEEGILVPGKTYDEWLAGGGNPDAPLYEAEANFTQRTDEWIREGHVEVFSEQGEKLVDINAGISVGGNATASYPIKSLNIKADEQYDIQTKYYNFVEDGSRVNGVPYQNVGTETNSVRLRNGGNDFASMMLRQSICNELAIQSGMKAVSIVTPVVVYINGEYYSLLHAQNNFSPSNIGRMLSLETQYIEEYDLGEKLLFATLKPEMDFSTADFIDPIVREEFEKLVDLEEFFKYYAIQIMIDNGDWPGNNYKVIRYTGAKMDGNPYSDGKIHYLFYDTDFAFQLYSDQVNMFELFFGSESEGSFILTNMMKYEPYKQQFVNTICDLSATSFKADNVAGLFDKYFEQIEEELPYLAKAPTKELGEIANRLPDNLANTRQRTYEIMNWLIPAYLNQYFGAANPYQISIDITEGKGRVVCNTVEIDESVEGEFVGTYYQNYPITVRAEAKQGYEFSHFVVNGQKFEGIEFICSPEMVIEGQITVEVCFESIKGDFPIIQQASGEGENDWIELVNPYENNITLAGIYLSDNRLELNKYECPHLTLMPGESIRILDKNNPEKGEYRFSFGIKGMETIYLSDGLGNIRDKFFVER